MLGLSVGARLYGVPYSQDAMLACQYWQRSTPVHNWRQFIRSDDFRDGCFLGHCYRTSSAGEQKVETVCGSFFLLTALLAWTGELDPSVV
ncbi:MULTISPECIES: hypothetical protein [unclassified Pseudomonas]|uniref:hypothetical protein n=1 Tax=unclassified Pseudomonas TaxID=196821 RepID=UPI00087741E6|nr:MULTISPECIES: hypothetical protein [unclassified Pseudomonas]SCZ23432.1 unsaturated chondroitin disaccharide hydrolase [Pseudomonas sp. NFACC44-2]SDA53607.1 unsaturated chondroitin disaccharide hydrolase [Pseudomonas sp. NFACC51]SFH26841.1 unsaturated chondroitin disaccharide hydrolase [Pseudomonas sp. NFACC54]SFT30738.1 unsaturated chondroitin disaccharide hydrolase [Pseudomonas sp. NFACC48-1]